MSDKTCKTCEWWLPCAEDQSIGTCAAFPEWRPMVKGTHWCGQWEPGIDAKAEESMREILSLALSTGAKVPDGVLEWHKMKARSDRS